MAGRYVNGVLVPWIIPELVAQEVEELLASETEELLASETEEQASASQERESASQQPAPSALEMSFELHVVPQYSDGAVVSAELLAQPERGSVSQQQQEHELLEQLEEDETMETA